MKKISDLASGMKKDKIVLCFLAGILLLVIALPVKSEDTQAVKMETETISTNASLLERQLEQVLTRIEGIGEVQAMITLEPLVDDRETPEIRGVLVVAESGDNPVEILKIQETVMTLFQIEAHRIKVMKLK